MSTKQFNATGAGPSQALAVAAAKGRPLQRLALVRRMQGVSRRTMARRMNVEIEQLRQQEIATVDLPLSVLYTWQKALDVPIAELLVEAGDSLALPVLVRSQLVRLMKTVLAVRAHARQESIQQVAQTMADQLIEIMPELADVSPWNAVGKRRQPSELGVAAHRRPGRQPVRRRRGLNTSTQDRKWPRAKTAGQWRGARACTTVGFPRFYLALAVGAGGRNRLESSRAFTHPDQHVVSIDSNLMHREVYRGGQREGLTRADVKPCTVPRADDGVSLQSPSG